ncbi:MAG: PAS domain-containing protein [Chloroflexi bacterium]|uniref:PAS domain-containing protein n=1 Tax=Candidatus Flexifilum breve TaxID=3140694 RepID=UPI003135AA3D|nr:PAS domain-containing protein [Chloroflexota bacterium]
MPFVADPLRPMNLPEPALYQLVVQNLPDLAILVFDHDLRYLLAEGDFLKSAGLIPQELIGRTLWEVFPPDAQAQLVPHYRARLKGEPPSSKVAKTNSSTKPKRDRSAINKVRLWRAC